MVLLASFTILFPEEAPLVSLFTILMHSCLLQMFAVHLYTHKQCLPYIINIKICRQYNSLLYPKAYFRFTHVETWQLSIPLTTVSTIMYPFSIDGHLSC
jgi:hypothetical protein